MPREVPDGRADGRPRRGDTGHEDQDHGPGHVLSLEFVAADLDVQEVTRQVVAGILDVVIDLLGEVLAHRLEERTPHF